MCDNCETLHLKDVILQENGLIYYKGLFIAKLFDGTTLQDIKDIDATNPQEDSLKVKVIKCNYPTYWYADHIGEIFKVVEDMKDYGGAKVDMRPCYSMKSEDKNNKVIYHIDIDDCEVI